MTDYHDLKTATPDTTVDIGTGLYFGADSQSDAAPAPRTLAALATALAARTETLTNKTITSLAQSGGELIVPAGPNTLATVAQLLGAAPTIPDFVQAGTGAATRTWQDKARERVSVDDFSGANDDAKIAAAVTYCKTLSSAHLVFNPRDYTITTTAVFDLPNHSRIDFNGVIRSSAAGTSIRLGKSTDNPLGYIVTGLKVDRATIDTSANTVGVECRNTCGADIQIMWVRDHHYGVYVFGDQANGGVSYSTFRFGIIHDNRFGLTLQAIGSGYVNENTFFGGSFSHSSNYNAYYAGGGTSLHLYMPDGAPINNNKFIGQSFEDGQVVAKAQAAFIGSAAVGNSFYHIRHENNADQTGQAFRLRPGSYHNQFVGVGQFLVNSNFLDESGGQNSWQATDGDYIGRRVSASAGAIQTFYSWWEDAAKVHSFRNLAGTEKGWTKTNGEARFTDLQLVPSASVTPAANGDLVIQATSNTSLTFKYKGSDGTVRSGSITLS